MRNVQNQKRLAGRHRGEGEGASQHRGRDQGQCSGIVAFAAKAKQSQTWWCMPGIPTLSSGLAWAIQRKQFLKKKEEKEKKP